MKQEKKLLVKGRSLVKGDQVRIAGTMFTFDRYHKSGLYFIAGNLTIRYPDTTRFLKMEKYYVVYDFGGEEENNE